MQNTTPMTIEELDRLPLSLADFHELRQFHKIYVDKTDLIYTLAGRKKSYIFLSRPRRFGKTLLVSTFESLFKYGLRDFKGLAIEKLWHDKTYPVIRINFADCKNFSSCADFKAKMNNFVSLAFEDAGLKLEPLVNSSNSLSLRIKSLFLKLKADIQPVLLIDEYDAPLNVCLNDPQLFNDIRKELNEFHTTIKGISGRLRFFFFTGICKYKNLNIFSDTNYITDISMSPDYGTLLGYTDDEVREYFTPFVENAARVLDISIEECFAKLKERYDGFCFDRYASTHVYTPWSVLSFLNSPQDGFMNYWYTSGGRPSILLNYITTHALQDPSKYGADINISLTDLDSSNEINSLNDYALLNQTGYLSIKKVSPLGKTAVLNYPNEEVAESMAQLYKERIFSIKSSVADSDMAADSLFYEHPVEEIPSLLNSVLTSLDYKDFPINDEASLRANLFYYIKGAGIKVFSELHNAYGRSDLEFALIDKYFVLELKVVDDRKYKKEQPKKIQALLDTAVTQIREKHYGESHSQGRELIRIGLVFSLKKKSIVGFKLA